MTIDISGYWHNEHSSVLRLVREDRSLSGTFRPGVGPLQGKTFPLQGVINGDQLAFLVGFGEEGSVTTWIGHICRDGGRISLDTLWDMAVRVDAPKEADGWRGIWSGADRFEPGEPALALPRPRRRPSVPA
jgi:hypothetical protein